MCRFTLHTHCLSELPQIVKHKFHLHPLTLTHSPIKDYEDEEDDAEYYCDACEEERKLADPTYYCAECHFVAHVHCGVSEILLHLQRESSLGDKHGNIKLVALDHLRNYARQKLKLDFGEEEEEEHVDVFSMGIGLKDHSQVRGRESGNEYGYMIPKFADHRDSEEKKMESYVEDEEGEEEEKEEELADIFSTGIGLKDHGQVRRRVDESSETEELVNIYIAGDSIGDELDAEITTVQMRVNKLEAQLVEITRQLAKETSKLDRLKQRRDQNRMGLCP